MKHLFSPTTDQVLVLFLEHPEVKFYANQIVQLTQKYPNSISQSLKRLEGLGLLVKSKVGKYYFYGFNKNHMLLPEIRSIMAKLGLLSDKWQGVEKLRQAFTSFAEYGYDVNKEKFWVRLDGFKLELFIKGNQSGKVRGEFSLESV